MMTSNNSGNIHTKHAKVVNKSNGNDNITIIDPLNERVGTISK